MVANVLVSRLRRAYWPDFMAEYTVPDVMRHAPIAEYRADCSDRDEDEYDLGRVRYFYEILMTGGRIDPIEIDSESHQYRVGSPITWGGPIIVDGHHRFAAAVLARRRTIPALLGGLVTTHRWLTGMRKTPPPEVRESIRCR